MNFAIKISSYLFTTFCLFVCIYEAFNIYFTKIPNYAEQFNIKEVKQKFILYIIFENILSICVYYLIIFLITYKDKNNENNNNERKNITFFYKMKNFINNNNLLIATYLLFYLDDTIYYKNNEILYLPFLFYIFMLFMYSKKKYLCGALRFAFDIVYFFIYINKLQTIDEHEMFIKSYNKKDGENIKKILQKFINKLDNNNYKLYLKQYKFSQTEIFVSFHKKTIFVGICGDILKHLTKNELTSALYHEFKHVLNGTLKRDILILSNYVFMFAAEHLMIYLSKKRINFTNSPKNCLRIYLFLNVTLDVIFKFIKNYFNCLDEYECDKYSALHHDKSYLISLLITISKLSDNFFKQSFLYNIMYINHPSLDRRINYINSV